VTVCLVSGVARSLRAFAVAADVRAGAEVDVAGGQAGELGDAQPGLHCDQQQRVVAAGEPAVAAGRG
jgi:hypothetical protein